MRVSLLRDRRQMMVISGTVLKPDGGLAALRAGCAYHNLSTSGSKHRCFQRLLQHSKKLELEMWVCHGNLDKPCL